MMTTLQHKKNIRQCFNRAVHTYDQYSFPQQTIGRKLIQLLLSKKKYSHSIIDLGCGSGTITLELAEKYHYKNFLAIDIAEELLKKAAQRLTQYSIQWNVADFECFNYENIFFDLIFSNMALQWSMHLPQILTRLCKQLTADGVIAFSLPLTNTFCELPKTCRNSYYSFSDIKKILSCCGYFLYTNVCDHLIYRFRSPLLALKTIQATGANYKFQRENNTKSSIKTLLKQHKLFSLTYHIGYFIAGKK